MCEKENALARDIREMAVSLGYEKCGMIPVEALRGFAEKLETRMARFPVLEQKRADYDGFADPQQLYPWAKAVVVCVHRYGIYRIPAHLQGMVAKYYLVDGRADAASAAYQSSILFERYLTERGLHTATNRKFGVTALRWAAVQAGLGVMRKNNFFYTESGSWVHLEAWLIDRPLVLISENTLPPCPPSCDLCRRACPTKALREPYALCREDCVSCITTWEGRDLPSDPRRRQLGDWVYGCDACQDACPHNKNRWEERCEFPGLASLAAQMTLEQLVDLDYAYLETVMQPKFWYLEKQDVWKWKVNALNAMCNSADPRYLSCAQRACADRHEKVREMAHLAVDVLSTSF